MCSGLWEMDMIWQKRERADREALLEGLADGTIDMIATDHAPHSAEEKGKGFEGSAYGIVGLETAFPVLYTKLVREGVISMQRLVDLLTDGPSSRFGIADGRMETAGAGSGQKQPLTFSVWDLDAPYIIRPEEFKTKGRSTPFAGWEVTGRCMMTVYNGKVVYKR